MWAHFLNPMASLKLFNSGTRCFRTIFVTANPVLRSEVRKYFDGLLRGLAASLAAREQVAAASASPGEGAALASAVEGEGEVEGEEPPSFNLHSLADLPDDAFPLFLTKREWLVALDGTLDAPFYPREADGKVGPPSSLPGHLRAW